MNFDQLKRKYDNQHVSHAVFQMIDEHEEIINHEACGISGLHTGLYLHVFSNQEGEEINVYI